MEPLAVSRRRALGGVAGVGIGLPVLAACGEGDAPTVASSSTPTSVPPPSAPPTSAAPPSAATTSEAPTPEAAPVDVGFASTADVPVGGGRIFPDEEVVVTQPQAGTFRCFSSICTHSGCPVTEVTSSIDCTCHGSRFALDDGAPTAGPAADPLPAIALTVEGDRLVLS